MGAGNYDIKDILKFLVDHFTGIGDMIVTTEALSTISEDVENSRNITSVKGL